MLTPTLAGLGPVSANPTPLIAGAGEQRAAAPRHLKLADIEGEPSDEDSSAVRQGLGALLASAAVTSPPDDASTGNKGSKRAAGKRPRNSDGTTELRAGRPRKRNFTGEEPADPQPDGPVFPNLEVDRARNNEFPPRPNPPTALAPQAMDLLSVEHQTARHALLTDAYDSAKADTLALASLLQERDREVAELRRRAAMAPHLGQMEEDVAEIKRDLQWLASHLGYPYESLLATPEAPDVSGMMIEPTASAGPSRAGPSPSPGM